MYASNEQEFNNEEKDWVFLSSSSPPANIVPRQTMDHLDNNDDENDDEDSISTSSSDSLTNICESMHRPSISSIEIEEMSNTTSQCEELLSELPTANAIIQTDENTISMPTDEIKEETCSAAEQEEIPHHNLIESSPVINEYDLAPIESVSNELRRRTGASSEDDEEEIPETMSTSTDLSSSTLDTDHPSSNKSDGGFALKLLIIIFVLTPFFLGPFLQTEKEIIPMTNQNDNVVSLGDIEQKLTKQIEEKFRILSDEKTMLLTQINDLHHLLNFSQESALNHIHQLTDENKQLKEEIFALKHRLETHEKESSNRKERKGCPRGTDRQNSSKSPLETLLNNFIHRTVPLTMNNSVTTLSSLFDQLTSSLNELVNRTSENIKEKKKQSPVRQQAENVSTDSSWTRSRAEFRQRARDETEQTEENVSRRPWRWTFQRSDDRERLRHQPMTTKKWMGKKDHVCHSKFDMPRKQWCSVKHWLHKHIRP